MKNLFCLLAVILLFPAFGNAAATSADTSIARLEAKQFPLVMFAVPGTDTHFSKVRSLGIDYVHLYGMTKGPVSEEVFARIQAYLDLAQKHNLKVMLDLDGYRRVPAALEDMRAVVRRFKDHPALGFWYLYDEPELRKSSTPSVLLPFYQMIKQEAPGIPVCICTSTAAGKAGIDHKWSDFGETYDILAFDTYPVRGQEFPTARLQAVTDFNKQAIALGEPVMPALQIFNYKGLPSYVKKAEDAGQSTAQWRYPTQEELRYWHFATLIQGARGMMYWSYMRSATLENTDPTWLDNTLKPATLEFREFTNLVHPAAKKEVFAVAPEHNIFMARWKNGAQEYLVLVNGAATEFHLTDRGLTSAPILQPLHTGKLQPWKFTRPDIVNRVDGRATEITLQPWEVAVWQVQP